MPSGSPLSLLEFILRKNSLESFSPIDSERDRDREREAAVDRDERENDFHSSPLKSLIFNYSFRNLFSIYSTRRKQVIESVQRLPYLFFSPFRIV